MRRSGQYTSGASSSTVKPVVKAHLAEHQPQADADRDQRHPEGGQQLEHQRRQERDPQRRHRRAAVGGGQFGDAMLGPGGAAQRPQRGDSGDQVQQPRLQGRHGGQRRRRALGGRQADQHHEDRDQRQRDHHDHSRFQVVDRRSRRRWPASGSRRAASAGRYRGEIRPQPVEAAGDHHRGGVALRRQLLWVAGPSPPPAPRRRDRRSPRWPRVGPGVPEASAPAARTTHSDNRIDSGPSQARRCVPQGR